MPLRPVKQNFATLRDQLMRGPGSAAMHSCCAARLHVASAAVAGRPCWPVLHALPTRGGKDLGGKGDLHSSAANCLRAPTELPIRRCLSVPHA